MTKFKINKKAFDAIAAQAVNNVLNNGVKVTCPQCHASITVSSTQKECPYCNQKFEFNQKPSRY